MEAFMPPHMEAFMPRIAIVGLACSTFLILLSSSAVPQEARAGADAGLGQLIFNNACRTCRTTKEGDNRLGPNLHNIIGRKAGSRARVGRGPHQVDYFLAIPHRRLKATSVFINLSLRVQCARTNSQSHFI
jgi:hypothetical protein